MDSIPVCFSVGSLASVNRENGVFENNNSGDECGSLLRLLSHRIILKVQ